MMRTANPALSEKIFKDVYAAGADTMTLQGTVNKTGLLLIFILIPAVWIWNKFFTVVDAVSMEAAARAVTPWMIGGIIGGLVFALVTIFNKKAAPYTAPIYALLEGLFLGAISAIMEAQFPGIVIQAVALTFGTLFVLLFLYTSGVIKATENFKLGIVSATGGIFLIYMATIVLRLFGINMPYIHGSGPMGIGFSLFVVSIAALNLVLDFDFIESGAESGAPRYMEWYGAFGLIVTLVWLYIEILRLLAKLQSRR